MNLMLSYCKVFTKELKLIALIAVAFPFILEAQINKHPLNKSFIRPGKQNSEYTGNLRTTATTCPVPGSISFTVLDTSQNPVGPVFACNPTPFLIYESTIGTNPPTGPCVETIFTNYHNQLETQGSEIYIEGGVPVYSLCPSCTIPIGDPFSTNPGIPGAPWAFSLYGFDPSQSHEFAFCRSGSLGAATTVTITLVDCWTGLPLPSTPPSSIFSNATTTSGGTCDTMKIAAGTALGTAVYSIAPASASVALTDFGSGGAYVNTDTLGVGTYTLTYSFTPPAGDACPTVTGTYTFSIGPPITVSVNSPTICSGTTATLTANASNGTPPYTYSWTPSTGLSASTGSVVTVTNPTVTTIYTVTAMDGGCSATATSTVTINPASNFSVSPLAICSNQPTTLVASNSALSYTWSPAATTTVSTSTDSAIVNLATTTVYTITGASSGGCPPLTLIDTIKVSPTPTISVFSPTVCVGTTATITATGATSYTWTPLTNLTSTITNDTVFISNPTAPASYTVMGMAANGCISSAVSHIDTSNHLGIVSGTPLSYCYGSYIQLAAIGASTYTWTSNDPTNLNFGQDTGWTVVASIANVNVGTYTVAIYGESHSGHYCNGNDTVYLTINPTPTITVVGSNTAAICAGNSSTLTVAQSGTVAVTSYNWSPSTGLSSTTGTTVIASPSVTTVYTATGTDAFGCTSSVNFTVNVTPVPSFTVSSPSLCLGSSDSLKVMPNTATSYSWSAGLSATTGTAVIVNATTIGTQTYSVFGTDTANGISCYSMPVTLTVTVNAVPTLTVSLSADSICIGSSDTLHVAGTATSYTWNPVTIPTTGTTVVATPTTSVVYTVSGSNANGCVNTATTSITVNAPPTFSLSTSSPSVCVGIADTIKVVPTSTITPSPSYTWSAPAVAGLSATTGTIVTSTPTGTVGFGGITYTVTATNGACKVNQTTHIQVHNTPVLSPFPGGGSLCGIWTLTLSANPVGTFTNNYTYTWTPSSVTPFAGTDSATYTSVLGPNSYTIQATNPANGCVGSAAVTFTVLPTPSFTVSNSNPEYCISGTSSLTAVSTSTVPISGYTWTPSSGLSSTNSSSVTASPTVSTTYTVSAIAPNGCFGWQFPTITVDVPPVLNPVASQSVICTGTNITLNANPTGGAGAMSYSWVPTGATSVSITDTPTLTPSETYTVYATAGVCPSTHSMVTVTIYSTPSVTATVNNPICSGTPIDLISGSTSSVTITNWAWSNSTHTYTSTAQNPIINNSSLLDNDVYTVVGSTGHCSSSPATVTVSVIQTPTITVSSFGPVCPNAPATYSCSGATSYSWSPSTGVTMVSPGIYNVSAGSSASYTVVGSTSGCPSSPKSAILTVDGISASFIPSSQMGNSPLAVTFTNTSMGATTYTWNYGNGSTYFTNNLNDPNTQTTYTIPPTSLPVTFTVTLYAVNSIGCSSEYPVTITVTETYSLVVANIFTPNGDNINDVFEMKISEGITNMNIVIFDRWGLKMFESTSLNPQWDGKNLHGKDVPDDTYFYILNTTDDLGKTHQTKGDITLLR